MSRIKVLLTRDELDFLSENYKSIYKNKEKNLSYLENSDNRREEEKVNLKEILYIANLLDKRMEGLAVQKNMDRVYKEVINRGRGEKMRGSEMVNKTYRISERQHEFITSQGNASAYIRNLVDREIEKEEKAGRGRKSVESVLGAINFKTAVMTVMLNELIKANPNLANAKWMDVNLSYEANWSQIFKDAAAFYKEFFDL